MRKRGKQLVSLILASALTGSLAGYIPTQSKETTVAPAKTQDTKAAENAAGTDPKAAGADTEAAASADMEVNTTDPIALHFNWWGRDSRHEKILKAVEAFEAKYPNVAVGAEYEAFNGHEEKISLALSAGSVADVVQLSIDWVFAYSPNGDTFYDPNEVSNIIDLSNYDDSNKAFYTVSGALQAFPIANTGRGFIWNRITYDKVGAKIPTTLDELYEARGEFAAHEDGSYYPFACAGYVKVHLMIYYLQCKYSRDRIKNSTLQYSKGEIAEGLNFIKELENKHIVPDSERLAGGGTSELLEISESWVNGHYGGAMCRDTNIAKYVDAVTNDEVVVGDMINMGEYRGGPVEVSQAITIASTSERPAEAAALIQFLFRDEEGAVILGDSRGVPCNKNAVKCVETEGSLVAEMNEKPMAWPAFKLDISIERAALKAPDGVYTPAIQSLSYGEEDVAACTDMLIDGTNRKIETATAQQGQEGIGERYRRMGRRILRHSLL